MATNPDLDTFHEQVHAASLPLVLEHAKENPGINHLMSETANYGLNVIAIAYKQAEMIALEDGEIVPPIPPDVITEVRKDISELESEITEFLEMRDDAKPDPPPNRVMTICESSQGPDGHLMVCDFPIGWRLDALVVFEAARRVRQLT